MTWNIGKTVLGGIISLLILLAAFGLGLLPVNLFFLKTTISEAVLEHAGAELTIDGPLRLRLGPRLRLDAGQVTINLPDQQQAVSANIKYLSAHTRLISVLRGDIDLSKVVADGITLHHGITTLDRILPETLHLEAAAPLNQPMAIRIEGGRGDKNALFSLTGASLDALLEATGKYPLDLELAIGATRLKFDGELNKPWNDPVLAGHLEADSPDLSAQLGEWGWEVPGLGLLSAQSGIRLARQDLRIERLNGELGDLPFTLSLYATEQDSRPRFELEAHLPLLDLVALPGTRRDTTENDQLSQLDLQPFFDGLGRFDGEAAITIDDLQGTPVSIDNVVIRAKLEKGLLEATELRASLADTLISGRAALDSVAPCAQLQTSVEFSGFNPDWLAPYLEQDTDIRLDIGPGTLTTRSCGETLADHLHSLETATSLTRLTALAEDGEDSLEFEDINARINWQLPGQLSFSGELMDEPLSVSLGFGSIVQLGSDDFWPIEIDARGSRFDLSLTGKTALHETGLALDLAIDGRLETSDISGEIAWSGVNSGLPLKVHFESTRLNLQEIDRLLPERTGEKSASGEDWAELLDQSNLIEHWHAVPSIDVRLAISRLEGTPYDLRNLGLDARLEGRQIREGRMRLFFEDIEMEGMLNADMRETTGVYDYHATLKNLDIGHLVRTFDRPRNFEASADRVDIRLASEGATLRELGHNLYIDTSLKPLRWSFAAGPENRTFDIELSELHFSANPGSSTTWDTAGSLNGSPIKAWLKTPDIRTTFDTSKPLPVQLVLGTGHDILMLEAVIQPESRKEFRSTLHLSGRFDSAELVDLSTLPSPLEDFELKTDLSISEGAYTADDIQARIGASNATGTFSVTPRDDGFLFEARADAPFLETDDLVRLVNEVRTMRESVSGLKSATPESEQNNQGLLKLVNEYVEEFVGNNAWNVQTGVDDLQSAGNPLGKARLGLVMDGGDFTLDPVSIELPGGNVTARYSGNEINGEWDYRIDVFIERLEYGGLFRLIDPDSRATGELFLDTSLHSRSATADEAVNHLDGHVDLAVFPDDINAKFLDLWASNLVLALLPSGDNQNKKLNCMVARLEVEDGVMKSKNTFLDSTEIIVRMKGEIDLAKRQLDLLAVPQAKMEKFLSVSTPIEVTGPFDDFQVGVASGGFVMTMLRWYYGLIYVPWKWLTGERFPPDGIATCYHAMEWDPPTEAR